MFISPCTPSNMIQLHWELNYEIAEKTTQQYSLKVTDHFVNSNKPNTKTTRMSASITL